MLPRLKPWATIISPFGADKEADIENAGETPAIPVSDACGVLQPPFHTSHFTLHFTFRAAIDDTSAAPSAFAARFFAVFFAARFAFGFAHQAGI